MKVVTVHKAKTQLSQLIAAAEAGEEVIIMRGRHPAARLVAASEPVPTRRFGALAEQISVGAEFYEPLPNDELDAWER